jgi:Leucine Rich repeat
VRHDIGCFRVRQRIILPSQSRSGSTNLGAITRLTHLDLARTSVNDLEPISLLTSLTSLNLQHTPIDDKGLAPIVALVGLDELRLSRTHVTGASYAYLKRLSKLKGLALNDTQVGDEGSEARADLNAEPESGDVTRI